MFQKLYLMAQLESGSRWLFWILKKNWNFDQNFKNGSLWGSKSTFFNFCLNLFIVFFWNYVWKEELKSGQRWLLRTLKENYVEHGVNGSFFRTRGPLFHHTCCFWCSKIITIFYEFQIFMINYSQHQKSEHFKQINCQNLMIWLHQMLLNNEYR